MNKIGTRNESSLHQALKLHYAGTRRRTEKAVAGFVADGISAGGEYIEIQTGSFGPLREKVRELAVRGGVRIIHPVIAVKYIEVFEPSGRRPAVKKKTPLYRRKSPRKGSLWDLFAALVYAPELPLIPGVRIELPLVEVTEIRLKDGKGSWRRKGVSILDRELTAWHDCVSLEGPKDYRRFVPFKKKEEFTVALLAERVGIDSRLARKTLYVLTKMKLVRRIGKQGNALVYSRS
jgi:hypothetical protein